MRITTTLITALAFAAAGTVTGCSTGSGDPAPVQTVYVRQAPAPDESAPATDDTEDSGDEYTQAEAQAELFEMAWDSVGASAHHDICLSWDLGSETRDELVEAFLEGAEGSGAGVSPDEAAVYDFLDSKC